MKPQAERKIAGILLAAGLSTRMGQPKMLLPWKGNTVIGHLLEKIALCPVDEIILVYGANQDEILKAAVTYPVRTVFNPEFSNGSMLVSLQAGLRQISHAMGAFLVILGDQPAISPDTIKSMIGLYGSSPEKLIIPSYKMHRGHPWLIDISLKDEILALQEPQTLRDFLKKHEAEINYLVVNDPYVLEDMDTPEDYQRLINL